MGMQGAHGTIEPMMHLFGTAIGWGLLPDAQAQYLGSPKFPNDGCYKASYAAPPFNEPGFSPSRFMTQTAGFTPKTAFSTSST